MARPKKPPITLRRLYAPLIQLATDTYLKGAEASQPSIDITWPRKDGVTQVPKGFPDGRGMGKTETTHKYRYVCARVLQWFYDNKYIVYSPSDLAVSRKKVLYNLGQLENEMYKVFNLAVDIDEEFVI